MDVLTMARTPRSMRRPKIGIPREFENEAEFLRHILTEYQMDQDYDRTNRDAATEDAAFAAGEQWYPAVRRARQNKKLPVITNNRIVAFIGQVIGQRRMMQTEIKVVPDHSGSREEAELRSGLIRNIQKNSQAKTAYDTALQQAVIGGLGNFEVTIEPTRSNVFEAELNIRSIVNPNAVVWDRMCTDPYGEDARHVFVVDRVSLGEFKRQFPWADPASFDFARTAWPDLIQGWFETDMVRVARFMRVEEEPVTVAMLVDGSQLDVTEAFADIDTEEGEQQALQALGASVMLHPETGEPMIRDTTRTFVNEWLVSGAQILSGPRRLPFPSVPVLRVPAWEIRTGDATTRFGLVRWMKDPQRIDNFMRSKLMEQAMGTSQARWQASKAAVAGLEHFYTADHVSNNAILPYNDDAQPPTRVQPVPVDSALVTQMQLAVQDMRDVTNMHAASLGAQSNERTGAAINARVRIGDVGTAIYSDNLSMAIERCGRLINAAIPTVYDTPRIVQIMGPEDSEPRAQAINRLSDEAVNITSNAYNVTSTTGPTTVTQRAEMAEFVQSAINANPNLLSVAGDLVFEAMDVPGASKIAARLRKTLPPNLRDPEDMDEQERAAMEQAAQVEQQVQQAQMQAAMLDMQLKQAQAKLAEAQALAAMAQAGKVEVETDKTAAAVGVEAMNAETQRLKVMTEADRVRLEDQLRREDRLPIGGAL